MTRKALRSAVLEVGLFYQKGWSVDRIARFTFRLHRRRLQAQHEAARAQGAARAVQAQDDAARARRGVRVVHAQGLTVPYQIEPHPGPWIGYAVTPSKAEARTANERLFDRVRALLRKRLSRPEARDRLGLPCAACGEPATGWSYVAHDGNGPRVIDRYATCAAHRSDESVETLTGTRSG